MPNTYTDRAVESLIINKMTQAQYDALPEKSDTELYLIDGGESSIFAEQMIVMPAASEAYLNRIVQFIGNSTMTYITGYFYRCVLQGGTYVWKKINVQANQGGGGSGQEIQFDDLPEATSENIGQILQYVGETIPDVCEKGYFYINQPEWSDPSASISQAAGQIDSISFETTVGNIEIINDTTTPIRNIAAGYDWIFSSGTFTISRVRENTWDVRGEDQTHGYVQLQCGDDYFYNTFGFVVSGEPQIGDIVICTYTLANMYDLSINVDKFIETEQPTQDETIDFIASVTPETLSFVPQTTWSISATPEQLKRMYADGGIDLDSLTPAEQQNLFVEYYNENNVGFGFSRTTFINLSVDNLGNYGITITGTPTDGESTTGVYTPQIVDWRKDGSTVDIVSYGISFNGTPSDGDTLTVSYSAPVIIGYSWNQINVQPSSGSGGGGIEWKATLDLPENYSGPTWETTAIVSIPNGLPNGDYEFYYQTLCYSDRNQDVKRRATVKVQFTFSKEDGTCYGSYAPVIDGSWMPSGNYTISNRDIWNSFGAHEHSNDFIFCSIERPFATDIPGYNNMSSGVKDCFKVSSFKNMQTGQEYIPVLTLYDGTSNPKDFSYSGYISMQSLQNEPYIPRYHSTNQWGYDDNNQYVRIQPYVSISCDNRPASCSELDVALVSSNGGKWHCIVENGHNSYVARVLEAKGDLANAQIGFNSNNDTFLFFNTESGTSGSIYASIGTKGSSESASGWIETPGSFTPAIITKVGCPVTIDNFGNIEQYTGATDANYTNGYFYKATGTEVQVPSSFTIEQTEGETTNIVCNDVDAFITYLAQLTGLDESNIREQWNNNYNYQRFMYAPNNIDNQKMGWSIYGWLPNDAIDYFTFTPSPSDAIRWNALLSSSHKEIQNGHWEQVNVQPGSSPSYPSTMPVLLQDNWEEDQETGELVQTIENIAEVHANSVVIVAPAPLSTEDYANNEVLCIGQGEGSLTFKCATIPNNDITVNVICL